MTTYELSEKYCAIQQRIGDLRESIDLLEQEAADVLEAWEIERTRERKTNNTEFNSLLTEYDRQNNAYLVLWKGELKTYAKQALEIGNDYLSYIEREFYPVTII